MQSGRVCAAIQKQRALNRTGTSPAEDGNGLVRRVKLRARFDYDQRTIQPAGKLFFIMQMCVIHECPCTRGVESDTERVTWLNLGRDRSRPSPPLRRNSFP